MPARHRLSGKILSESNPISEIYFNRRQIFSTDSMQRDFRTSTENNHKLLDCESSHKFFSSISLSCMDKLFGKANCELSFRT